ncbi:MAG TPA: HEAT repeat domain-containing protein [Kofleriaceae bacterium]|nr:HEAT repeat domain-containing protein [Kofleriaceae bacterium]
MVFGLFSKEKSLQRTIEKATNKLAQQPDRWGALEKLKDDGTEGALLGLCRRFAITSMKGVEDEAEKLWVVDTLVGKGDTALPPLVRYMKTAEQLAFPLRVLERIASREKVLEVVDGLFASEPPGYVRMPDRRIDLLRWFAEWRPATDDEVISRLTPYVTDFDENVRFAAIDGMAARDPARIAPPLIAALVRPEEESGRIKRAIVEVLERCKAPLGDQAAAVGAVLTGPLGDSFKVDGGVIKPR